LTELCDDAVDDCELNVEDGAEETDSAHEPEGGNDDSSAAVGKVAVKGESSVLSSSSGTVVAVLCELVRPKTLFLFVSSNTTGTTISTNPRRADRDSPGSS
jgi:hypothetical protein